MTGTLQKVRTSGTVAIGYREASIPLSYLSARNEPIGYSIDLCRAIVDAMSTEVGRDLVIKWVPVTSENRIDAVVGGQVDLECGSTTANTGAQESRRLLAGDLHRRDQADGAEGVADQVLP